MPTYNYHFHQKASLPPPKWSFDPVSLSYCTENEEYKEYLRMWTVRRTQNSVACFGFGPADDIDPVADRKEPL